MALSVFWHKIWDSLSTKWKMNTSTRHVVMHNWGRELLFCSSSLKLLIDCRRMRVAYCPALTARHSNTLSCWATPEERDCQMATAYASRDLVFVREFPTAGIPADAPNTSEYYSSSTMRTAQQGSLDSPPNSLKTGLLLRNLN